jgi:hypothetical protein
LLNLICIIIIWEINFEIAARYTASDGKTQSLFGIIEVLNFSYKYYFLLLSAIALYLAIKSRIKKEARSTFIIAILLNALSIALILTRVWKILI